MAWDLVEEYLSNGICEETAERRYKRKLRTSLVHLVVLPEVLLLHTSPPSTVEFSSLYLPVKKAPSI